MIFNMTGGNAGKKYYKYLFNRGTVNLELAGGFNGTIKDDALYYTTSAMKSGICIT